MQRELNVMMIEWHEAKIKCAQCGKKNHKWKGTR